MIRRKKACFLLALLLLMTLGEESLHSLVSSQVSLSMKRMPRCLLKRSAKHIRLPLFLCHWTQLAKMSQSLRPHVVVALPLQVRPASRDLMRKALQHFLQRGLSLRGMVRREVTHSLLGSLQRRLSSNKGGEQDEWSVRQQLALAALLLRFLRKRRGIGRRSGKWKLLLRTQCRTSGTAILHREPCAFQIGTSKRRGH